MQFGVGVQSGLGLGHDHSRLEQDHAIIELASQEPLSTLPQRTKRHSAPTIDLKKRRLGSEFNLGGAHGPNHTLPTIAQQHMSQSWV